MTGRDKPPPIPTGFRIQRDPARGAEIRGMMQEWLSKPQLPDDVPPLEKIKILARAGYFHRYGLDEAEFEAICAEAFPDKKSSKKR